MKPSADTSSAVKASADKSSAVKASFWRTLCLPTLLLPTLLLQTLCPPTLLAVEVQPLRVEVTGTPGEAVSGSLTITNHRAEPVQVVAAPGAYRYGFTARTILPDDPAAQRLPSCESWVSLRPPTLELAPHGTAELAYTILVPADAAQSPAGEYVAAILVDEQPADAETQGRRDAENLITVVPRIAIPLYLVLDERQAPSGRIAALEASPGPSPSITRLLLTIANDGRAHLRPSGTLLVANDRQEVVWRGGLGRTVPIFPKFQEGIPVLIPLIPGRYSAVATVDVGGPELLQRETRFTVTDDGSVEQSVGG